MKLRYVLVATSLLALSGCKNLQTVQALSATLVTASSSLDSVSNELTSTCIRQEQFNPALQCADSEKSTKGLIATDTLLTTYFSALGDAAGAQSFTVKTGLDNLTASVSAIPGINQGQVSAASGLAETIATLFTEAAREKALRTMIDQGVPQAKTLVAMLGNRVPHSLSTSLRAEQDALTSQFVTYAEGSLGPDPAARCVEGPKSVDFPKGANLLLALEYCHRLQTIQAKQAAIASYQGALGNINAALDTLASSKSDLTAEQLVLKLRDDVSQLKTNLDAVNTAFGKGGGK